MWAVALFVDVSIFTGMFIVLWRMKRTAKNRSVGEETEWNDD
jgi:hypothetical protein